MSAEPGPTRRQFCAGCCLLVACAALGASESALPAEDPPLKRTRETRAGLKPGALRDYRKEGRFFLMADDRGIYALTAICTHNGCTVTTSGEEGFLCPCHESEYDQQGRVTQGPARLPLRHLKVLESAPGALLEVDTGTPVEPDARL